jgi:hypothetical protein
MYGEDREPTTGAASRPDVDSVLEQLEALREPLTADMPIESLERFEAAWKRALGRLMQGPLSGADARFLAAFQRDVGLLPKYKSYAIKASGPLGYSVFFQQPGKGFSFQQHRHHKIEIFHILEAMPGAFAFVCTLAQWSAAYDAEGFSRWLEGAGDPRYERWRIPLAAGDVICLESTGVVHTVIGCVLEEFATASTDLVDRLHDQNEGAPVPSSYRRERALDLLGAVPAPRTHQKVAVPSLERLPLTGRGFRGGEVITLGELPGLRASRIRLESGRQSPPQASEDRAAILFTSRGDARLLLGTAQELARHDPPALELRRGMAAMVPPAMTYEIAALDREVEISVHAIRPGVALSEEPTP